MIHWKIEFEKIQQGLSVYPPSDPFSAGFVLRIGKRLWRVRYSKSTGKWHFNYAKQTANN